MLILKISKERLVNPEALIFSQINSIKMYDFSTVCTTIPREKLKSRLFDIIDNCSLTKMGKRNISSKTLL
jgi:hypothetical protein